MANQWKMFTPEEVEILSENLWVKKVTPKLIRYTEEFKEEFLRQRKKGKSGRVILENLGFNPSILGEGRIIGLRATCRDYELKKRLREGTLEEPEFPVVSGSSTNAQLKRMQHKMNYMEQQIEFIKKTILTERKARRSR